jgi:hypothetical protein
MIFKDVFKIYNSKWLKVLLEVGDLMVHLQVILVTDLQCQEQYPLD